MLRLALHWISGRVLVLALPQELGHIGEHFSGGTLAPCLVAGTTTLSEQYTFVLAEQRDYRSYRSEIWAW